MVTTLPPPATRPSTPIAPVRTSSLARAGSVDFHASTETLTNMSETTLFPHESSTTTLFQEFRLPEDDDFYGGVIRSYADDNEGFEEYERFLNSAMNFPRSHSILSEYSDSELSSNGYSFATQDFDTVSIDSDASSGIFEFHLPIDEALSLIHEDQYQVNFDALLARYETYVDRRANGDELLMILMEAGAANENTDNEGHFEDDDLLIEIAGILDALEEVPAPPLVGIETNPGPQFLFDDGFCMSEEEFQELQIEHITDFTADLSHLIMANGSQRAPHIIRQCYSLVLTRNAPLDIPFPFIDLILDFVEMFGYDGLIEYFRNAVSMVDQTTPAPRLVGVEPNPGPRFTILLFFFLTTAAYWESLFNFSYVSLLIFWVNYWLPLPKSSKEVPATRLVGIETNPGPFSKVALHSISSCMNAMEPQINLPFSFGLDDSTQTLIMSFMASLERAADAADHAKLNVTSSQIQGLIDNLPTSAQFTDGLIQFVLLVVGAVCNYKHRRDEKEKKFALLTLAISFYIGYKYGPYSNLCKAYLAMAAAINVFVDPSNEEIDLEMQPQMGIADSFMTPVLGYIYYKAFSKNCTDGSIAGFMKDISDFPKQKDGLNHFIEFILGVSEKFVNFLLVKFEKPTVSLRNNVFPEIEELHGKIMVVIQSFRDGAPYNYDNAMLVFFLDKEVNNVIAKIPNTRDCAEYKRSALSLLTLLKPLIAKMERNNIVGNGPRREPLGILLGGATGVGKSTTIIPLILATNSLVLPDDKLASLEANHNDHIWNFIPENPFHDAYHGQFNTFIDEAGAYHDVAGTPDPGAMAALRMINNANFPLHMAHLEDKGNVNFCSEMVWATTNRTFFEWKSMYCSEAYTRRFKVSMLHVPKVEYCAEGTLTDSLWDRRLDVSKIPPNVDNFDLTVNEFYPYDFFSGVVTGAPLSTEELIDYIVRSYETTRTHSDNLLKFHSIIKQKYIKKRNEMKPQFEMFEYADFLSRYFGLNLDFVKKCIADSGIFVYDSIESINGFWSFASRKLVSEEESSSIQNWIVDAFNFACDNPFLIALAALIPACALFWKYSSPLFLEQSAPMKTKPGSTKARSKSRIRKVVTTKLNEQFSINQTNFDLVNKIVCKNLYSFQIEGVATKSGYFLFLGDRIAICPEHFICAIEKLLETREAENIKLKFTRTGSPDAGFEVHYSDIEIINFDGEESDLVFIKFPQVCHPHADLRSHFLPGDSKSLEGSFNGGLVKCNTKGYVLITTEIFPGKEVKYGDYGIARSFAYNIATVNGDCGAPIFLFDSVTQKAHIIGIHVAGNNHTGASNFVDKKFVDNVLTQPSLFSANPQEFFIFDKLPEQVEMISQMGPKFVCEGSTRKNPTATKSKVKPSPLHSSWGPSEYAPPLLVPKESEGVLLDPWKISRDKYSLCQPAFDMKMLALSTDITIADIHNNSEHNNPWKPRVLSFEEAVRGIPGVPFCESIPRDTSAGYPYNLDVKLKGKKDFFGEAAEFDFTTQKCEELKKLVQQNIKKHASGLRTEVLYADYLKDERRKKAKIALGKTRPISASPLDYLIECRMYFGDFVRWVMQNRIRNGMAIGVNAYSHEWSGIVQHLSQVGDDNIFGDYSGFDTSLSQPLMYKALEIIESFYVGCPQEDKMIRAALFMEVVNSRHVTSLPRSEDSLIYEWYGSNPSGNFLTTVLNSLCNLVAMRYAILLNIRDFYPFSCLKGIVIEAFKLITYGDDNGLSVRSDFLHLVDQQSMTTALATIKMVYTNESKTDDLVTLHRPLADCSFLKRGFVYEPRYKTWLAPLELAVVLEMPYWTKSNAPRGSVEVTVDNAMMELALHGSPTFYEWAHRIATASGIKLNHFPRIDYQHWLEIALHCEGYQ